MAKAAKKKTAKKKAVKKAAKKKPVKKKAVKKKAAKTKPAAKINAPMLVKGQFGEVIKVVITNPDKAKEKVVKKKK
jgi:hypothetical protein